MKRRFASINDLPIQNPIASFVSAKPDGHSGGPRSIAFAKAS
jgi:nuclear transport factor 2 (NTF2) superfamily protein